jgi:tyrosine-protein phosphatase YwqE
MGVFTNIFGKKDKIVSFDLSSLGVDIHSHLIPGIDDGSKTIEDTIILAKGLQELGYKKIITTPHIMSDYYQNNPEIIRKGLSDVKKAFAENNILLDIDIAAEYYIDYEFTKKIGNEELLTFGDNYILIEFSFLEPTHGYNEAIFKLQTNGYKPILAHPERYSYWYNNPSDLLALKDKDVMFQLNLLSLTGLYGEGSLNIVKLLLENSFVDWLGTDMHHLGHLGAFKNYNIRESFVEFIGENNILNSSLL